MDRLAFYALFVAAFLLVMVIGCWITEKVIPHFKRFDDRLAELARQKKD